MILYTFFSFILLASSYAQLSGKTRTMQTPPANAPMPSTVTSTQKSTSSISSKSSSAVNAAKPATSSAPASAEPALVTLESDEEKEEGQASAVAQPGQVIFVTTQKEVDQYVGKGKPVVLKVSTESCGPCKMMKPIFIQVAAENPDVHFLHVDADKSKSLSQQLIGNRGYPTTVTYDKDGKQLRIDSGSKGKTELTLDVKEAKGLTMIMTQPPTQTKAPAAAPASASSVVRQSAPQPPSQSTRQVVRRIQPSQPSSQASCPIPVARNQRIMVTPRNSAGAPRGVVMR